MKVREVMTPAVVTVRPWTPFKEAAELLVDHRISGLPVVDWEDRLLGIVTEADLVSKEAFAFVRPRPVEVVVGVLSGEHRWADKAGGLTAGDVMSRDVVTASPDESIQTAARRMLHRRVKRLPVVEDGRLVGIISRHDLLRLFHRSDEDIAAEIDAKLHSPVHCPEEHSVVFSVADGVVNLTGGVESESDAMVVEGMAARVPGVVHVESHLTFKDARRN